ncbi:MAG: hypothetical protein AB8G14_18995 [Ilumatobacter sp.]
MTQHGTTTTDGPLRRPRVVLGALAGAVGVIVVMPFFYPFGRIFDPTVGGDTPTGLLTELTLGFIGGVVLSPIAGIIGGVVAFLLGGRRIGPVTAVVLIVLAVAFAIGLFAALNGGLVDDDDGSLASLRWAAALGSLAGSVAVAFYVLAQRPLRARLASTAAR